jgi:hypothetical protein
MAKKGGGPDWTGFRFPARILTQEEQDLLSPICDACTLSSLVVELQEPLTKETRSKPLIDFREGELKFYCAYHAPLDVPDELTAQTDREFFLKLRVQVHCERYDQRRMACVCITYGAKCVKRCDAVKRLMGGVDFDRAAEIIHRERKTYDDERKQQKLKEESQ